MKGQEETGNNPLIDMVARMYRSKDDEMRNLGAEYCRLLTEEERKVMWKVWKSLKP